MTNKFDMTLGQVSHNGGTGKNQRIPLAFLFRKSLAWQCIPKRKQTLKDYRIQGLREEIKSFFWGGDSILNWFKIARRTPSPSILKADFSSSICWQVNFCMTRYLKLTTLPGTPSFLTLKPYLGVFWDPEQLERLIFLLSVGVISTCYTFWVSSSRSTLGSLKTPRYR